MIGFQSRTGRDRACNPNDRFRGVRVLCRVLPVTCFIVSARRPCRPRSLLRRWTGDRKVYRNSLSDLVLRRTSLLATGFGNWPEGHSSLSAGILSHAAILRRNRLATCNDRLAYCRHCLAAKSPNPFQPLNSAPGRAICFLDYCGDLTILPVKWAWVWPIAIYRFALGAYCER